MAKNPVSMLSIAYWPTTSGISTRSWRCSRSNRSRGLTDDQGATFVDHAAVVRFDPAH
jgi:hypothetical protein